MHREQTTVRLPGELKDQLQKEADRLLQTLQKILDEPETKTWEEIRELQKFLLELDEQYCCIMAHTIEYLVKKQCNARRGTSE